MRIKHQIKMLNSFGASSVDFAECVIGFDALASKSEAPGKRSAQAILFLAKLIYSGIVLVYCTVKDKEDIKYIVQGNVRFLRNKINPPKKSSDSAAQSSNHYICE